MRRFIIIFSLSVVAAVLGAGLTGCRQPKQPAASGAAPETVSKLASVVNLGNPEASNQLLEGFYKIEGGSWRWTKKRFSVILAPPPGSASKGAELVMRFAVPPPVINKLGPVTISAKIGSLVLAPETCKQAGLHTYRRDLGTRALASDAITVTFSLDKFLPPSNTDRRELGIIVSSIGLVAR